MTTRTVLAASTLLATVLPAMSAPAPSITAAAIDGAAYAPLPERPGRTPSPEVAKVEALLDRARFPSGPVDGMDGDNLRKALRAYQVQNALAPSGKLDQATWDRLTGGQPVVTKGYRITAEDAKGPFTRSIPAGFEAQSKLPHLGYRDLREELAERFHMGGPLLDALNPGAGFREGDTISVVDGQRPGTDAKAARIVVDKKGRDVEALAADGSLIARYPASIGSVDKPAPTGSFTIHYVAPNPTYKYNPKYHFKGVSATRPFLIEPGPNNPVGAVWMDLGGHGYGIHGTPDPSKVGKTQSHGCIRMANWDALDLASMVARGTPVSFGDVPGSVGPVAAPSPVAAVPPSAPTPGIATPPLTTIATPAP